MARKTYWSTGYRAYLPEASNLMLGRSGHLGWTISITNDVGLFVGLFFIYLNEKFTGRSGVRHG